MNKNIADWIDNVLDTDIPDNIVAFCFNLYEEWDGNWSMELVGTDWFAPARKRAALARDKRLSPYSPLRGGRSSFP